MRKVAANISNLQHKRLYSASGRGGWSVPSVTEACDFNHDSRDVSNLKASFSAGERMEAAPGRASQHATVHNHSHAEGSWHGQCRFPQWPIGAIPTVRVRAYGGCEQLSGEG